MSLETILNKIAAITDGGKNSAFEMRSVLTDITSTFSGATTPITNTSELTNDGEDGVNQFITSGDTTQFITSADTPTNTSELINDGEDGINPYTTITEVYGGSVILDANYYRIENFEYFVYANKYVINGELFNNYISNTITLSGASLQDRIDVIAINNDESFSVIQGIPGENPIKPDISGETQIELTFVLVQVGTTEPTNVFDILIYDENVGTPTEWNTSVSSAQVIPNYGGDSQNGSTSIAFSAVTSADYINFDYTSTISGNDLSNIVFRIKLLNVAPHRLSIRLYNTGTSQTGLNLNIDSGLFGFDNTILNTWQTIIIPKTLLGVSGMDFDRIRIFSRRSGVIFLIDNIIAQNGTLVISTGPTITNTSELTNDGEDGINPYVNSLELSAATSGTSEWSTYTGTRVGGDLIVTLADYDFSGTGTKINIDVSSQEILLDTQTGGQIIVNGEIFSKYGIGVSFENAAATFNGNLRANVSDFRDWILPDASGTLALTSDFGDYIPLSGTGVGSPVTGDIEFEGSYSEKGFINTFTDEDLVSTMYFSDNGLYLQARNIAGTLTSTLNIRKDGVGMVTTDPTSKGVYSNTYHAANYDDNTYVQKKYVDDNYIPLSGTLSGSPVTGVVELIYEGNKLGFFMDVGSYVTRIGVDGGGKPFMEFDDTLGITGEVSSINLDNEFLNINANHPLFKGILGSSYYGANYTDNTYVQKKYVDDNYIPLSGTLSGSPVTGDIEFSETNKLYKVGGDSTQSIYFEDGDLIIRSEDNEGIGTDVSDFNHLTDGLLLDSNNSGFYGIRGIQYYGANYDDNTYVQKKYVDDNYIPLSGTGVGSPVTGVIESTSNNWITTTVSDQDFVIGVGDDLDILNNANRSSSLELANGVTQSKASLRINNATYAQRFTLTETSGASYINITGDNPAFKGLDGFAYYGANYTDNTYVQKKYVDDNYIPLSGTEVGSPVTGRIEVEDYIVSIGHNVNESALLTDGLYSYILWNGGNGVTTIQSGEVGGFVGGLDIRNNGLEYDSSDPSSKGIYSTSYYGANYNDNTYVQKKYVDDNYIPLSGTLSGSPVTGDIEIADTYTNGVWKIHTSNSDVEVDSKIEFNDSGFLEIRSSNTSNSDFSFLSMYGNSMTLQSEDVSNSNNNSTLSFGLGNYIRVDGIGTFKGFEGSSYFGANYTDNTYVQKKYVDDALTAFTPTLGGALVFSPTGNTTAIIVDGRNETNYGDAGVRAKDLSHSTSSAYDFGAIGQDSFASGYQTRATGNTSTASGYYTTASGVYSFATGYFSNAINTASFVAGYSNNATGQQATAFGRQNNATGNSSFVAGFSSDAIGVNSTAFGINATASGNTSLAIGSDVFANGDFSTAFGRGNSANGDYSFVVGFGNTSSGYAATTWGRQTIASANCSTASGFYTNATGFYSTSSGVYNTAPSYGETVIGLYSTTGATTGNATTWVGSDRIFNIGNGTASGSRSDALTILKYGDVLAPSLTTAIISSADSKVLITKEYADANYSSGGGSGNAALTFSPTGNTTGIIVSGRTEVNYGPVGNLAKDLSYSTSVSSTRGATGSGSFAVGGNNIASSTYTTVWGFGNVASGVYSTAGGASTQATGNTSTALGNLTIAGGQYSTAFGNRAKALAGVSTAWGDNTTASGYYSTAFGYQTTASGYYSTAFGTNTTASSYGATAFGSNTTASANYSTASGYYTNATGFYSNSSGAYNTASSYGETVIGLYSTTGATTGNTTTWVGTDRIFNVGNGTGSTVSQRSDALTVYKNGHTEIGGTVKTKEYTVATLPSGEQGMRAHVTDANATTFYSTVAGGGANVVPVFYNGSDWVIG